MKFQNYPVDLTLFQHYTEKNMDFNPWLTKALKSNKIDVGVYHSYLLGILEDNIDECEKRESVTDIIASLIVSFFLFLPCKELSKNFRLIKSARFVTGIRHRITCK